ncbi:ANTH-domain-containing protein, partial [Atractiella rhizophila]
GTKQHVPTRPVDKDKAESELTLTIKKATNPDETAPKQKHVRKCIVYSWDYHDSQSIWAGLRVQPILADEVQTFKALITVHKILQEGHPIVLKQAQQQTGWLETCARTVGNDGRGYTPLIKAYVSSLLAKLRFHKTHPDFNGLFEYEEYVTLKGIDDPNEGYETISDLMNLQDQIDSFQKLIFAHFRGSTNNECRISALVPQVKESYGIYRFITSMLRAMHRRTDAADALEPLRQRYNSQHYNLRKFYYECSNLKYLTGLINVPKLPQEPPNLFDSSSLPDLPARPKTVAPPPASPPPPRGEPTPDIDEQRRMLKHYEDQQAALKKKQEEERRRAEEEKARFDAMRREQEERERMERERMEQLRRDQEEERRRMEMQMQMGRDQQALMRVQELEREMMGMRGQYERDQMMLEQYDRRVKALEQELMNYNANLSAQLSSKDELIKQLQEQVALWKNKYEALAKLYSQLRTEHLDMLSKFKQFQLKANSAQEAIERMERMERDMKAKNLELADMIRERDRARFESDRLKSSHKDELERLRRDLRFAEERAEDAGRNKSSEVSGIISKYNRQINELEDSLRSKNDQIEDLLRRLDGHNSDIERARDESAQELEITKESLEDALRRLQELDMNQGETDAALLSQIDLLILDQKKKLNEVIDSILQAGVSKIDDAIYELESPVQMGNKNSTPDYVLSLIEKATTTANEFAATFSFYLSREKGGEIVEVIKSANNLSQSIADVLVNTKGITPLTPDDDAAESLIKVAKNPGDVGLRFFLALQSYRLEGLSPTARNDIVVNNSMQTRTALQKLAVVVEQLRPKQTNLSKTSGEIGDLVENEMANAAKAIEAATARLQALMSRPKDRYSAVDVQVHDAILEASLAITRAIGRLIQAATETQQEIVASGRGSGSTQAFYKRNNRWTEGLISAAKAVAWATTNLIQTADGVIDGSKSLEQLIVASNEVAASTAQLVQASRVKSDLMSKTQEKLELAAKAVQDACKALVKQVKAITSKQMLGRDDADYNSMGAHEFKMREMEVQVSIVTLEKELGDARRKLGEMRRAAYHTDESI